MKLKDNPKFKTGRRKIDQFSTNHRTAQDWWYVIGSKMSNILMDLPILHLDFLFEFCCKEKPHEIQAPYIVQFKYKIASLLKNWEVHAFSRISLSTLHLWNNVLQRWRKIRKFARAWFFKVNSIQETCTIYFAVHLSKFEILLTTWKNKTKNFQMLNLLVKNWELRVWCSLYHFIHVICKISNFDFWTAKHLAQASCTKAFAFCSLVILLISSICIGFYGLVSLSSFSSCKLIQTELIK